MINRHFPYLLLLVATVLLSAGCQTIYTPSPTNMPLLSQDGETQIAGTVGSNGYGFQGAWAPVEHVAVMGNFYTYTQDFDSAFVPKFRHTYGDIGLGGWTRLDKFVRLEAFAGIGWGVTGELPRRDIYRKYFFQPSLGWSGRFIDAGFSPKLSIVNHKEVRDAPTVVHDPVANAFLEPTLMLRAGYNEVKFMLTGSYTLPLGSSDFSYQDWTIGFGFHITLGKDFERYDFTID